MGESNGVGNLRDDALFFGFRFEPILDPKISLELVLKLMKKGGSIFGSLFLFGSFAALQMPLESSFGPSKAVLDGLEPEKP